DVRALGVSHPLLDEGLEELVRLVEAAAQRVPGVVRADLKIARGLDYYTGSVYETTLVGHEGLGSICSGGRYDSLASDGKKTYPGVGISVGVTRLVSRLLHENLVTATRSTPTAVLVAVWDEQDRMESENIAAALRGRGIAADVSPTAAKLGRQIRFAARRGIPFVWFPGRDGAEGEVKDIRSGEQAPAEASNWSPPADEPTPRVVAAERGVGVGRCGSVPAASLRGSVPLASPGSGPGRILCSTPPTALTPAPRHPVPITSLSAPATASTCAPGCSRLETVPATRCC